MASEKSFENRVKKFLKDQGCYFIKYWGGGEFTKAGVPDILVCCNGKFLGVEVKAPNGRPSPLQIHNLKKIDDSGGYGILSRPRQHRHLKRKNSILFLVFLDFPHFFIHSGWQDTLF